MIERKAQHRASLNDLKTFLATTEPFCHYSIPEELEISTTEKARPSFANRFDVLQESVIMLRNNDRSLAYCP